MVAPEEVEITDEEMQHDLSEFVGLPITAITMCKNALVISIANAYAVVASGFPEFSVEILSSNKKTH
jgi:hypothetical protein